MSTNPKMIVLESSDGVSFEINEAAVAKSVTIKNIIEEDYDGSPIQIPNVDAEILEMVIEYCTRRHVIETEGADDLKAFDSDFVKVEQEILFELMMAANYLNIGDLFDLTCQTVADMMKNKTTEEIREIFCIVNDYTLEEEAEIRKDHAWAFDEPARSPN